VGYRNKVNVLECQICKLQFENESNSDVHHIIERKTFKQKKKKVDNNKRNILNLCPTCHRKIHLKEIIIDRWYLTTKGYQIGYYIKGSDKLSFS